MKEDERLPLTHGEFVGNSVLVRRLALRVGLGRTACLLVFSTILLVYIMVIHVISSIASADENGWYEMGGSTERFAQMQVEETTPGYGGSRIPTGNHFNRSREGVVDAMRAFQGTLVIWLDLTIFVLMILAWIMMLADRLLKERVRVEDVTLFTTPYLFISVIIVVMLWANLVAIFALFMEVPCSSDVGGDGGEEGEPCINGHEAWTVWGMCLTVSLLLMPPGVLFGRRAWRVWKKWCLAGITNTLNE